MGGPIVMCGGGRPVPDTTSDCPDRDQHTPTPAGYVDHAEWAARMIARRATQKRCPSCGLYAIWRPPMKPMPDGYQ